MMISFVRSLVRSTQDNEHLLAFSRAIENRSTATQMHFIHEHNAKCAQNTTAQMIKAATFPFNLQL